MRVGHSTCSDTEVVHLFRSCFVASLNAVVKITKSNSIYALECGCLCLKSTKINLKWICDNKRYAFQFGSPRSFCFRLHIPMSWSRREREREMDGKVKNPRISAVPVNYDNILRSLCGVCLIGWLLGCQNSERRWCFYFVNCTCICCLIRN